MSDAPGSSWDLLREARHALIHLEEREANQRLDPEVKRARERLLFEAWHGRIAQEERLRRDPKSGLVREPEGAA